MRIKPELPASFCLPASPTITVSYIKRHDPYEHSQYSTSSTSLLSSRSYSSAPTICRKSSLHSHTATSRSFSPQFTTAACTNEFCHPIKQSDSRRPSIPLCFHGTPRAAQMNSSSKVPYAGLRSLPSPPTSKTQLSSNNSSTTGEPATTTHTRSATPPRSKKHYVTVKSIPAVGSINPRIPLVHTTAPAATIGTRNKRFIAPTVPA